MDKKLRVCKVINALFSLLIETKILTSISNSERNASVRALQKLFIFIFLFFLDDLSTGMDYYSGCIKYIQNNFSL